MQRKMEYWNTATGDTTKDWKVALGWRESYTPDDVRCRVVFPDGTSSEFEVWNGEPS